MRKIDLNDLYNNSIIRIANMKIILGMGNKRNLSIFCQFIENIKNIAEFITFNFEENRLYSQGMSGDHCSIFELEINADWFECYKKDDSDASVITFRTATMAKILDTRHKSQFLVLNYTGNPEKLSVILKNKSKDESCEDYPKEFELPLINLDYEVLTIPETEYSVEFNISSTNIRNVVEQLMLFDSVICMHCDDNNVEFRSNGDDGVLTINLFDEKHNFIDEFAIEEEYDFKNDFDAKHVHSFCKFSKIAKSVDLGFTTDFPMCMKYDMEDPNIKLKFLLAPRVKED